MSHDPETMRLIDDIASFVAEHIERHGSLNHDEAVRRMIDVLCPPYPYWSCAEYRGEYDREYDRTLDVLCPPREWWVFAERSGEYNKKGEPIFRFKPEILQALWKRTGDSVIWGKNNRAWFKRKSPVRKV
jgi:hypothetical protein